MLLSVTGTPFKVSFAVTLPTVVGTVVLGVWLGKVSATASITWAVTAKLVWELSFVVLAFPWETFNGIGGHTPHSKGLLALIYTILPKIKSGPLTTFPLTVSIIYPTSKEPKPPFVFFNLIVFPEPDDRVNNVQRGSLPGAIPIISASEPTDIVTLNELVTIVPLP